MDKVIRLVNEASFYYALEKNPVRSRARKAKPMTKIRPQFRWKTITLLAGVLVVGIGTAWFFVGKLSRRQGIVSRLGQCRFTIGASWRYEPHDDDEEFDYIYRPSNPIQRWLEEHLQHRSPGADIEFTPQPVSPKSASFQNGYPVIPGTAIPTHHLFIDGCPATVFTFSSSKTPSTLETHIFFYSPGNATFYEFVARSYRKGDQIDHEMQAIIASFHIGKE